MSEDKGVAGQEEQTEDECVVVGIGASAGGLDAYKQLLQKIPDDSGLAFVLIQHLDPSHKSLMVELLSKYTSMPVLQVDQTTPIQPNHVYMIPPNRFIKLKDGGLLLVEAKQKGTIPLSIDYFFRSLAEARKERAICVVLSGTGSDGADGIRVVKAEGGMTIAQNPDDAEYDGMPRSAIATGSVDFVLPIDEMADVIIPYAKHPYVQSQLSQTVADSAPDHFRAILSLLHTYTDQDFSRYKKGTLTRRIDRRMGILHISSPAEYLKRLREDHDELRRLFKDLLIGVTRFFRDSKAWDNLSSLLSPKFLETREEEEPLRIWVPGCSTGEEAYSIAMLVAEQQQLQHRPLDSQVFATDIDEDAIEVARLGIYPENIRKDISEKRLDTHFQREGEQLRVRKKLRKSCIFAVQNLLSDPPFSNLDLICCRNLLIYLESDVQGHIFDMLHFALKPNGILFLGTSESPTHRKHLFKTVSQSSRIYQKIGKSETGSAGFPMNKTGTLYPSTDPSGTPELNSVTTDSTVEISKKALLEAFAPASVVINHRGIIQYIHGPIRNYLDFPSGEPDLEICSMVLEGLKSKTKTAFQHARSTNETVSIVARQVSRNDGNVAVNIRVHPIPQHRGNDPLFLVSFVDEASMTLTEEKPDERVSTRDRVDESFFSDRQLALELKVTKEDLQSSIEELESANEELKASNEEGMSMNEELQSTNEELETSREELQSLNEELSTVNHQLHDKVQALEAMTDDLSNLLVSTDMATLFLDRDLRIRRYTPSTTRLMNIIETDIGRPISDLSTSVYDPEIVTDAQQVLDLLIPIEKEVKNDGGQWFIRRIMPFRTGENKIEGVVITFVDITKVKQTQEKLEFREKQQAMSAQLGCLALTGCDLQFLFDRAVRDLADILDVEYCKILRLNPDHKELLLVAGTGWQAEIIGKATVPAGMDSQSGYTLQTNGPVIVNDLATEKRFSASDLLTDYEVVSGMSVLIGTREESWGVLGVHSRQKVDFKIDDTSVITAVANILWEAIRRKQSEMELRDNEARTAAFLSTSFVIGWMKDDEGKYIYVSPNYQKRLGIDQENWLGKTDFELWPRKIAEQFKKNDLEVLRRNESIQVIEELLDSRGEKSYYFSSKFPFADESGKHFIGGLGVDITERIHIERELARSEERLRLAARMAGFGTYYVNLKTNEITWSPELKKLFGMEVDDPIPVNVGEVPEFVHPDDQQRLSEKIKACLDPQGDGEIRDEHRIILPSGKLCWVLVQGRTVFKGKGESREPSYTAGVVLDITERHATAVELEEARRKSEAANEAKSVFLANMSHEIRTPLTAILGYADLLLPRLSDPDAQICAKSIKESGYYLCDILNDVLDFSKIEAGKFQARPEECSVIRLLADVRSMMAARATEKGLTLSVQVEGKIPTTVTTDRKMIRQILLNLVGNAIKFTEEGGVTVSVKCLPEQALLEFEVLDTGVGIEQEEIEALFEPFVQHDNSFSRLASGSGLGLAICRKLVNLLGGEIEVESELQKGSTFRFTARIDNFEDCEWVWVSPESLSLIDRHTDQQAPLPAIQSRVLVVDDRPEIRFLVRSYIENAGGTVLTANNGRECINLWKQKGSAEFDQILMDIQMPSMDGLEATKRLRADGFNGPIIALTATVLIRDKEKCLQAGCDEFVSKPIDQRILLETLSKWERKAAEHVTDQLRILCVDDHELVLEILKTKLEQMEHRVEIATTGADALQKAQNFRPDFVFLDLGLREMSGGELLTQLKTRPELTNTMFVCLSGRGGNEVPWKSMGFDQYIQKPAEEQELKKAINLRRDWMN